MRLGKKIKYKLRIKSDQISKLKKLKRRMNRDSKYHFHMKQQLEKTTAISSADHEVESVLWSLSICNFVSRWECVFHCY